MLMHIPKKRRHVFIALLLLTTFAACAGSPKETTGNSEIKDDGLVGTWRFASMEARSPEGQIIYPYGENIFGRLVYTADGFMSVLLMNPDRPRFGSDDPMAGTPDEIEAAFRGFDAYCGTYTIDKEQATVTHHIQASKFPNWIGTDQVRSFESRDGRLTLKADIDMRGETWKFKAILEKLESARE
jgi:hypothetical protein